MAKLTWDQYRFLSEYCIASYIAQSYTSLQTGSGPLISATSYQMGVNTFAAALHSIAVAGADVAAQLALLTSSPGVNIYALITPFNTVFSDVFNLAGLPVNYINSYGIASYISMASTVLPEPSTSGGGGSSEVTMDFQAFSEALAASLNPILIRISNYTNEDFL